MSDQAWIALAALAAFLFVQVAIGAFLMGGLFARVKRTEDDLRTGATLSNQVAALNATMTGFQATMAGFEKQLEHFSDTLSDTLRGRSGQRSET